MRGYDGLRIELGAGEPLLRAWWNGGRRRGGARLLDAWLREVDLSWGGESPNISSNEVEVLREVFVPVMPNRNGGALLSGVGRVIPSWNDCALLFARLGRRYGGRRLLQNPSQLTLFHIINDNSEFLLCSWTEWGWHW